MDRASTFGLWLKQRRKAGDLTQEQLAERVGCAAETLRKIETDARRPSRAMVDRIAQVLEVPPAERPALIQWARTGTTSALADQPARPAATTQPRAAGPLLRTKLYLPRVRAQGVARPRLLAQLDHGMTGRLTALVAPPGFGKTTLLAEWANQWAATCDGRNVAWLTLDAADSEPEQFLRYLIAALRTVAPEIGGTALRLIAAGDASHIAAALPLLLNDLDQLPGESVLILDDYHAIAAPAVHESVSALLDHLPPHLHLIIASRADPPLPLARLRVRGELAELRAADLRFTPAETAAFLHDSMRLPLAPGDIATLARRTEGWAAGLQLAGLSLQGQSPEQITAFVAAFGGSHHYIVDYLIDEVLSKQPAPLQRFLLHTAILERLCGALCDAVLGQAASAAGPDALSGQDILRELERKQLFVVPLDDEWRWFRFHQLFADVLRERLARTVAPEQIALLHRRAAQWHAAHGATGVAVRHALAAHDWELAADLIERASGVGMPGDVQHGETLRAWLDALPASVVRARPKLCLLRARHALLSDLEQAAEWSRHAEQALANLSAPAASNTFGEIAALRAGLLASRGAADDAIALAEQALRQLDPDNLGVRGEVMQHLARAYLYRHDTGRAAGALAQMAQMAQRAGQPLATLVADTNLAYVQRLRGEHGAAMTTCRRMLERATEQGIADAPDIAWALAGRADLLREQNELDAAYQSAAEAVERSRQLRFPNLALLATVVLARVDAARGDWARAHAGLAALRQLEAQFRVIPLGQMASAIEAQLYLQQGAVELALPLLDAIPAPEIGAFWISPILAVYGCEHLALAPAQVLLAQGRATGQRSRLEAAHVWLGQAAALAERDALPWLRVKVLALLALTEQELGAETQSLATLSGALEQAAAHGYLRVLLDEGAPLAALLRRGLAHGAYLDATRRFGRRLAAAFAAEPWAESGDRAGPTPLLVEPLTPRELEVLRQLSAGRSNQAIAAELIVAVGTVKRHLANILAKLDVDSRLAAVARARDLGLL